MPIFFFFASQMLSILRSRLPEYRPEIQYGMSHALIPSSCVSSLALIRLIVLHISVRGDIFANFTELFFRPVVHFYRRRRLGIEVKLFFYS